MSVNYNLGISQLPEVQNSSRCRSKDEERYAVSEVKVGEWLVPFFLLFILPHQYSLSKGHAATVTGPRVPSCVFISCSMYGLSSALCLH